MFLVSVVAAALVGFVDLGEGAAGQDGTPAGLEDLQEGIVVEHLAGTAGWPFGPPQTSANLARYTYAPGARLELPDPGPVLAYVEAGALSLEAVGPSVSIRQPGEETVLATPGGGQFVSSRQEGAAPAAGERAEVRAGGSAYAPNGTLGPTRKAGDSPLVLLVVAFVPQPGGAMSATAVAAPTGSLLAATPAP